MKGISYCIFILFISTLFLPALAYNKIPENEDPVLSNEAISKTISVITKDGATPMDIEEYLLGVVLAEMPASYEEEALKAQTVAARTYTLSKLDSSVHEGGICTDYSCCQAYISPGEYDGGEDNLKKVEKAVNSTKGEIMTYEDKPIVAVFHSMSAGKTTSAQSVWGNDVPYLTAVDSPMEEQEENFITVVKIPMDEFSEKLKAKESLIGNCYSFSPPEYDSSGYVESIIIGGISFSGTDIRSLFSLRSSSFSLSIEDNVAVFTVKGYGHGVGLSQHGANLYAKSGMKYDEILSTYYKGASLSHM